MRLLGPGVLARLDDALVERIGRGRDLGAVIASAIATIVLGAGTYGAALGIWRAPEQALYSAVKVPLLFLVVSACTIASSAMLAMLLRARLSLAQTTVCILLSFAVTSAILGALAPIAMLVAASAPPPDPDALGLAETDARALPSIAVARSLLLGHVFAIACAGTAGVARVRALLTRLGHDEIVARRVLVGWISAQFLVGSELAWLLRPFFGRPHRPPSFSVDDALEGSFFEEVATLADTAFGAAAPLAIGAGLAAIALGLASSLRARRRVVEVCVETIGLRIVGPGERIVPWPAIASARAHAGEVVIELVPDDALVRESVIARCHGRRRAIELARAIEDARSRARVGPFRTAAG